jgi:hypothetical protein
VRLEVPLRLDGEPEFSRIVVTDRHGDGVGIETPVPDLTDGTGGGRDEWFCSEPGGPERGDVPRLRQLQYSRDRGHPAAGAAPVVARP